MDQADHDRLLFRLRTEGKRVSVPRIGEAVFELDGKLWRYWTPPEEDRQPGAGPWRVDPFAGDRPA